MQTLAVWVALLFSWGCGTGDDRTTSSGGAGGAPGSGAGGAGASSSSGGACRDVLVTEPVRIGMTNVPQSDPVIAAIPDGSGFALVWHTEGVGLETATVSVDGSFVVTPRTLGVAATINTGTSVAAHDSGYGVTRLTPMDGLFLDQVTYDGDVASSQGISAGPAEVVANDTGFWLTLAQSGELHHTFVPFGTTAVPTPSTFPSPPDVFCCGGRQWKSHALPSGELVIAWQASSNDAELTFMRFDATGSAIPASRTTFSESSSPPTAAANHAGATLFADDETVLVVDEAGSILSSTTLSLGSGASVGASDDEVRIAVGSSNGIDWYAAQLDGLPPRLLMRFEPGTAGTLGAPKIAWNGTGFGVVWLAPPTETVRFAYLEPCAD